MSGSIGSRAGWLSSRLRDIAGYRRFGRRRGSRGFTLIESLCAVAVLAIALSALFKTYSGGVRAVRVTDDFTTARILAQSIMEQAIAMPGRPRANGGRVGAFEWRLGAAPALAANTEGKSPVPISLHLVSVEVAWPPARSISLTSMKLVQDK